MTEELSIATEPTVSPAEEKPVEETVVEAETPPEKVEKTPEQREIERLRRGLNRKHEQAARANERLAMLEKELTQRQNPVNSDAPDEPVQLTRAQIRELVNSEAQRLAQTIHGQATEAQRYASVQSKLEASWDADKFKQVSEDLDAAFGGLEAQGKLKPALEAAFEADNPTALLEYLADPEHHDEAQKLSRMSAVQAGREIAKLEAKLAKPTAPTPSKAPAPLEPIRGGATPKNMPDPSDTKAWIRWANSQERR